MTEPLLAPEPTVTAVKRGFTVSQGGKPHWVFSSCERDDVGYWCETHQVYLEQRSKLVAHAKTLGDHVIARCCQKHGFEAPQEKLKT